jgi:ADP-heptose:LPS heptosyltransferase
MRILFITSTRIGDAVLSTALLDHLLRAHPTARVTVACGPAAEGVFARMPRLDGIHVLRKRRFSLHWLGLWAWAAMRWWDLVVDLRASALAWLVPARRRLRGKGGRQQGHRLDQLGALAGLRQPLPVAWTAPQDEAKAASLLPGGPWLVLGPTANWSRKVWPAERFVAVAKALTGSGGALAGAGIAVLGGPGGTERAMAAPVLAALPGAVDLVGTLEIPEVAAVLRRAALFLGNDSGLMHLAAAAGAPTIGLFAQSDPREYGPAGPRALAVAADAPPFQAEMSDIPESRVLDAAGRLLARAAAA